MVNNNELHQESCTKVKYSDYEYTWKMFTPLKYRAATGVLSNIDHLKNPSIDQILTTQHFIDQILTAKVP